MKLNSYVVRFIAFVVAFFVVFSGVDKVSAKTLASLKNELKNAEQKYNDNQSNKERTEEEIQAAQERFNSLNREKAKAQKEVEDINVQLEQLSEDIAQMEKEIKFIINYYQLSSSTPLYLEYIFSATSYTDFIYRLAVSEQLSEYRQKTIDKFNKLIEENNRRLKELADKKIELESIQAELSNEISKLGDDLSKISEEAVDIKSEIADLKKQINTYENTYKCSLNEELSTCIENYNKSVGNGYMPSAAGFYRPIYSGALNYEYGYTEKYGAYHDGVDFSIPHGTTVYSVADGVVVAVKSHQSCGGNMVYIGHNVNGKTYTSAYFHLADPILVKEGQTVTHNTIIGHSGGVHAYEWWDSWSCSTGAHLHFQIATGIYMRDYYWYSDFRSKSFNPRYVINFPATDVKFTGR